MSQYIETIAYLAGVIVTLGAAIKVVKDAKKELEAPHKEIKTRLDFHEECLTRDNQRLKRLEDESDSLRADMHQVLLALLSIMKSDTPEAKEKAQNDLNEYLVKRK